ncbi:MAG: FeoA family protein [Lachnospiraceae bacterium]|nr:FeoA family protein [Lachnospiraceae bacterium]
MTLRTVEPGKEVQIKSINTEDEALKSFLFSLGCYAGESVRVIFKKKRNLVLTIKNGRYSIDSDLASMIEV